MVRAGIHRASGIAVAIKVSLNLLKALDNKLV